jgi:hypothetical protein
MLVRTRWNYSVASWALVVPSDALRRDFRGARGLVAGAMAASAGSFGRVACDAAGEAAGAEAAPAEFVVEVVSPEGARACGAAVG